MKGKRDSSKEASPFSEETEKQRESGETGEQRTSDRPQKQSASGRPGKGSRAAGVLMLAVLGLMGVSYSFLLKSKMPEEGEYRAYEYHIAMIADEADTDFWKEVYQGAVTVGQQEDAYVEWMGDGLIQQFSMEDAINMAIYEDVDGILLCPSDSGENEAMIHKAYSQGIPVITMQKDVPDSRRQGFVGMNDYFLGQEYGKRVLKIADEATRLVTVLLPGDSFNETSRSWFRQGLVNTVQTGEIEFDFRIIQDDRGLNNAEDVIHDMAEGNVEQPQIMICLDEVITQSTYQLIREKRLPQGIKVIGSYISDDILEGIRNGALDSTITIDPAAMGRISMEVLMTYKKYHMASYYTEVDTMLIDQEAAAVYGEGGEK